MWNSSLWLSNQKSESDFGQNPYQVIRSNPLKI